MVVDAANVLAPQGLWRYDFLLLMHPFAKKELTLPSHKVLIKKLQL